MEHGDLGDPGVTAWDTPLVHALNGDIGNATIQHRLVEELHALDHLLVRLLVVDLNASLHSSESKELSFLTNVKCTSINFCTNVWCTTCSWRLGTTCSILRSVSPIYE